MADISVADVKKLRERTGAGMVDAKKALTEANGDIEAAVDALRAKGLATAQKKSSRTAAEGLVGVLVQGTKGVAVEINSETDFVAKNDQFQSFVRNATAVALETGTSDVEAPKAAAYPGGGTVGDKLTEHVATIGEHQQIRRLKLPEGLPLQQRRALGLAQRPDGRLWVGLVAGLYVLDRQTEQLSRWTPPRPLADPADRVRALQAGREEHESPEILQYLERNVLLRAIDRNWQNQLTEMEDLRRGVSLRSYAQKDPLNEYKAEAFKAFERLMQQLRTDTCAGLFRTATSMEALEALMRRAGEKGWRVFLLGAREEVVSKVAETYQRKYPRLVLAGYRNGYWKGEEEEALVAEQIRASRADLLFVAISSPKKEQFLGKYQAHMRIPFAMGVGGTFDVSIGKVKRAPVWMQKSGLEWFYRFLQEPRRMFRRYFIEDMAFIGLLLQELRQR